MFGFKKKSKAEEKIEEPKPEIESHDGHDLRWSYGLGQYHLNCDTCDKVIQISNDRPKDF